MTKSSHIVVLYGSQTGVAESIAQNLHAEAHARGYEAKLHCLKDFSEVDIDKSRLIVFITSTTGEGDPPDNAHKFFRQLRRLKGCDTPWAKVEYALLGLGDTNYNNFCNAAKKLQKKLNDLCAAPFYPAAFADDATGLEETVEPWLQGIWPAIEAMCEKTRPVTFDSNTPLKIEELVCKTKELSIDEKGKAKNGGELSRKVEGKARVGDVNQREGKEATDRPALYTIPPRSTHNFGKLHIPGLPVLDSITNLTNLPKLASPTLCFKATGISAPISENVVDFCSAFVSKVTGKAMPPYSAVNPYLARITNRKALTAPDAVKTALEMEFDVVNVDEWGHWQPGDAFGVCAPVGHDFAIALAALVGGVTWVDGMWQSPLYLISASAAGGDLPMALRDRVLTARPSTASSQLPARGHYYSVYNLFRYVFDATSVPKKALLRALADMTPDESSRKVLFYLCSRQGTAAYKAWSAGQVPTLLHVLESIPSLDIKLDVLFSQLPPLTPRYYSHTLTPLTHPTTLNCIFNTVEYDVPLGSDNPRVEGERRQGIATPWLAKLDIGAVVPVFPHPSAHFHLPHDTAIPLILVGPGTGIAPLAGFLRHRAEQIKFARHMQSALAPEFGPIHVYQGCRDPVRDWLLRNELASLHTAGVLTRHRVAFSRTRADGNPRPAEEPREYVQDLIRADGEDLARLIEDKHARVFVCGDAHAMGRDVMAAFTDILCAFRREDRTQTVLHVMDLSKNGRYLQDLW